MKIVPQEITVREIVQEYKNCDQEGAFALSGKLNIRPPYQREFIYKDRQRDAVLKTV